MTSGRKGHWGLAGMRERAAGIGATLRVLSRPGAGTEVELAIPNGIAFGDAAPGHRTRWIERLRRRRTVQS